MRKAATIAVGLLFVLVTSAVRNEAGTISGTVYGQDRHPISDILVEIYHDQGKYASRTRTNTVGFYAFRGLADGNYLVRVQPFNTNYAIEERNVTLATHSQFVEASEEVNFTLRPKNNKSPSGAPTTVFVQDVPVIARQLYETGIQELARKNERLGLDKLRRAIEAFPTYYDALARLGMEYVMRNDYDSAKPLLTKAVEVNARSHEAWFGLGLVHFQISAIEKAIDSFRLAVEINPSSVNAHLWHGIALHSASKLKEAEAEYAQADKLGNGSNPQVNWQLARLYIDQERNLEAAKQLELFLKQKPDAPKASEIRKTIERLKQKSENEK